MTHDARPAFPTHVRTQWLDFSPALHYHARTRIDAALRSFRRHIKWTTARIADAPGPGTARVCEIEIMLTFGGWLTVSAEGSDAYRAVDAAARRARAVVRRHVERLRDADQLQRIA